MMGRSLTRPFVIRQTRRVISEKLAVRNIVWMAAKPRLAAQAHALRGGRYRLVRGHDDEWVALLVGAVVIFRKSGVLARMQVQSHVHEGEPAHLDQAEEALGAEQTEILLRVPHVPVGGDEARHGVEDFGGLARVGRRLVGKVADFDACCEEALHVLFWRLFEVAEVIRDFCWGGRGWFGRTMGGGGRGWLGHVGKGIVKGIKG